MRMIIKSVTWALVCLFILLTVGHSWVFAQGSDDKKFKQEELDQMLAPIALYPDDVLTQLLMASTYPLEIVQAERWVKQNKSLKGDALKSALEKQTWDASVKALASFPEVLTMMNEKLEWTQKVGDAFLGQPKEVMDTVQKLRAKAVGEGSLKSSKEQEVKKEGDIIIIQPTNPQVVYVPAYDPMIVYGAWWYPAYPPYPYYPYPPGAALFTFTMGVAIGAAWHNNCHADWHGGTVNIDRDVNIDRGDRPSGGSGGRPGGGGKGEQWKHNPQHRQGVSYRDQGTRDKYSPTNRAAVDSRQGNRGYDKSGVSTADRGAGKQPSASQRGGSDSAFGGSDRGSDVRQQSDRGSSSRDSMSSRGGSSGGGRSSAGSMSSGRSSGGGFSGGGGGGGRGGGGGGRR